MPAAEPETVPRSAAEVPLYTPWDAARYLRLPVWAVAPLDGRWHRWPDPEYLFHVFHRRFRHPGGFDDDRPLPPDRERVSFLGLAALFVRAGAVQALAEWDRLGPPPGRWPDFYHAVWRDLEDTAREPVPFDDAPAGERAERLSGAFGRLDDAQRALVRKWIARRLGRVETAGGRPVRVYPFARDPAEGSPRLIVLDPLVRFGRPCVVGRGVPTDSLYERYQAGDSVAELAADYGLTAEEVEEAVRFEAGPIVPVPAW